MLNLKNLINPINKVLQLNKSVMNKRRSIKSK